MRFITDLKKEMNNWGMGLRRAVARRYHHHAGDMKAKMEK